MRLIDADALLKTYKKWIPQLVLPEDEGDRRGVETCIAVLEYAPTIKAEPVRHGRWIDNHCSECGKMPMGTEAWERLDIEPPRFEWFMDFCPCCGAKMDGDKNAT